MAFLPFSPTDRQSRDPAAAEKRCGPWFDRLTMRDKPLKTLDLILSPSKDEANFRIFQHPDQPMRAR
jgi:hypothetical protein